MSNLLNVSQATSQLVLQRQQMNTLSSTRKMRAWHGGKPVLVSRLVYQLGTPQDQEYVNPGTVCAEFNESYR
jgi:hypothetical protein